MRKRLTPVATRAMKALAKSFRLSNEQAQVVFGICSTQWASVLASAPVDELPENVLRRVQLMNGLYMNLRECLSKNLADEWLLLPNSSPLYRGSRPLDVILDEGFHGLERVARHVAAMAQGY